MILTLTASIMYWHLKQKSENRSMNDFESGNSSETTSTTTMDDSASESSIEENGNR